MGGFQDHMGLPIVSANPEADGRYWDRMAACPGADRRCWDVLELYLQTPELTAGFQVPVTLL